MERNYLFLKYFLFMTFVGLLVSCNDSEENLFTKETIETDNQIISIKDEMDFFWHNGQKYYLIPDSTKYFVVYNDPEESTNAKILNEGFYTYNHRQSSLKSTKRCSNVRVEGESIQKWQIIENSTFINTKSTDSTSICYKSPYYKSKTQVILLDYQT